MELPPDPLLVVLSEPLGRAQRILEGFLRVELLEWGWMEIPAVALPV